MKHLLAHDAIFSAAIDPLTPLDAPVPQSDLYLSLLRAITYQQLSGKVADVIYGRFRALFADAYPQPQQLAAMPIEELRAVGLSNQKANYLKNIAHFSLHNDLSFATLDTYTDDELISHLTQIKGVGRWTVEMMLIFSLARPDVFPVGDLGIRNAAVKMYQLSSTGKQLEAELLQLAAQWQPNRSMATRYLWHWLDSNK